MMRELRGQFTKVFRTREGMKFNGELSLPIERTTPSDFRPRRLLTVSQNAVVQTGDIVTSEEATFLVTLSATFTDLKQFKCFEITHRISWTRKTDQVDPVTGMLRDTGNLLVDEALPVVIEYGKVVENLGIETDKYKILTGADVKVGDRLSSWVVQTRKEALGLKLLEVA
jgi:hypothetical protein